MAIHNITPVSRRLFLAAAAVGLTSTVAPARPIAPLRAGLIGAGAVGDTLMNAASSSDIPLDIVAVADTNTVRLRALPNTLRRSTEWDDLVGDPSLDALIIATPDHLHAPMTEAALLAGKRVYLVPPLARIPAELTALRHANAMNPGHLHIAGELTSNSCWAALAARCKEEHVGTPRWIQADILCGVQRNPQHWSRSATISDGDAAVALFSTLFPLMMHFSLGAPSQSTLLGGVFGNVARETPDTLSLSTHYENGLKITLTAKPDSSACKPTLVRGTRDVVEQPSTTRPSRFDIARWAHAIHRGKQRDGANLRAAFAAQNVLLDALTAFRHS